MNDAEIYNSKMKKAVDAKKGWWSLSAYAFDTEPVGGKEGWTVLRLAPPDGEGEEGEEGEKYVLWETER